MRHTLSIVVALGLVTGGAAAVAGPGKAVPAAAAGAKPTRACGVSAIPLQVGNEWTYVKVGIPDHMTVDPNAARKYPREADKIVIDVIGVETQNNVTTVQLEEDVDGHKLKTTITCTADKLTVSPDSFFFAAEPGGAYDLDYSGLQHKPDATTLKLAGGKITGPDWRDDVAGAWKQLPTPGNDANHWQGKLELERYFKVIGPESVNVGAPGSAGTMYQATKVTLDITGRVTLDPPDPNPLEFPEHLQSIFWFVDGVGIVQTQNSYGPVDCQSVPAKGAAPAGSGSGSGSGSSDQAPQNCTTYGHRYDLVDMKLQK